MGNKWYAAGLRFECTQCGHCCSGEPGYVWVTSEEARRIARFLGQQRQELNGRYIRRVALKLSLTEEPNGDCVFLTRGDGRATCRIYPVRPLQCRTWPFWDSNLRSPEHWAEVARTCTGIDQGRQFSASAIENLRDMKS